MDGVSRYKVELTNAYGYLASSPEAALRNFLYACEHETVLAKVTEIKPGSIDGCSYVILEIKCGQVLN